MDTKNPLNAQLISSMKSKATEISVREAFLESLPQLILQLYIFTVTGIMGIDLKSYLFSNPVVQLTSWGCVCIKFYGHWVNI